jgi:hypothetical protein
VKKESEDQKEKKCLLALIHNYNKNAILKHSIQQRLAWLTRRITSPFRALPDFLIVGAQKSGTSSLFAYLSQHPQILAASKKETHYFDGGRQNSKINNFQSRELWCRTYFPLKIKMRSGFKTFEATPEYIFHPKAPQRIHKLLPNIKMILLLRNPTDRAIFHYYHAKRKGYEPLTLENALKAEYVEERDLVKNNPQKYTRHA